MSAVDRSPALHSAGLATTSALVAALATAPQALLGFAAAVVGTMLLGAGVSAGRRRAVSLGAAVLLAGVLYGGGAGGGVALALVGVVGTAVAWDVAHYAIGIGEQLGRAADTRRAEAVHAATSLGVGGGIAGVGFAVYWFAGGGQPLSALLGLLVAAILLTWALSGG